MVAGVNVCLVSVFDVRGFSLVLFVKSISPLVTKWEIPLQSPFVTCEGNRLDFVFLVFIW